MRIMNTEKNGPAKHRDFLNVMFYRLVLLRISLMNTFSRTRNKRTRKKTQK